MSVVGIESPIAHPSFADSMYTELRGGFDGGLMYDVGFMSRHVPSTPVPAVETVMRTSRERTITPPTRVLRIEITRV